MKYILSDERKVIKARNGQKMVLYRIIALREFTTFALRRKVKYEGSKKTVFYQIEEELIRVGQKGGYVQSLKNLSQKGSCWIDNEAFACGESMVMDEAYLGDHAGIGDRVKLCDTTKVIDFVQMGGEIVLCGRSKAFGSGNYCDKGRYRDAYLGDNASQIKEPTKDKKKENISPEKPLGGKIKIECQIDGKKIVNDFEF